ncbi:HNH endonuclease [Azoarcus sp. L1K30]|uniref:HNH endonuclease n=1 Tax=Azoarcus sp. L1K30 TaxID=2820277 RepID=UPI001B81FA59|nr:HNH endonuclease [Azoarcus sp. L1K30]MBR0565651.1 HNH endonuclease [Azoarcus sp. L1K30]
MPFSEEALAGVLGVRFRLSLSGCVANTPDGPRQGVRATDIPEPNGFAVLVSSGWKSLEAGFFPDTYAGDLVRAMGRRATTSHHPFLSLASTFEAAGKRISMKVNGSVVLPENGLPPPPWNQLELRVRKLTDATSGNDGDLQAGAETVASACLALLLLLLPLEEEEPAGQPLFEAGLPEGACSTVTVNRYERNPANRAACIAAHGARCGICGFDFGTVYGSLAHGYIEVHHRTPVSRMGGSYQIDPVRDLIPLCANCHVAVHRVDPPMPPETLREIFSSNGRRSPTGAGK